MVRDDRITAGRSAARQIARVAGRRAVLMLAVHLLWTGAAWAGASHPDNPTETAVHVGALAEHLTTIVEARYLYLEAPLQWRLEQSYQRGESACLGETLQHSELKSFVPGREPIWDRHVRRGFDFGDLDRIVVKPGAYPDIYSIAATFISGSAEAYTVTISTKETDIEIEYYGSEAGRTVPLNTSLFFSTYYHNLFVIMHSTATDVAVHLQALARECGAGTVEIDDLTR
jgi:hypothetical protein